MSGHRDSTVSMTVGTQVAGLQISETLVDSIWGPTATMDAVADGLRNYLTLQMIFAHNLTNGGSLQDSQNFVEANIGRTE